MSILNHSMSLMEPDLASLHQVLCKTFDCNVYVYCECLGMSPGFATSIGCHAIAKWYFEGDCALSKPRPPAYQVSEKVFWSALGTSETSCWSLRQSGESNGGTSGWMIKEFREEIVKSRWEAGENGTLPCHGVNLIILIMYTFYEYNLCILFVIVQERCNSWCSGPHQAESWPPCNEREMLFCCQDHGFTEKVNKTTWDTESVVGQGQRVQVLAIPTPQCWL